MVGASVMGFENGRRDFDGVHRKKTSMLKA
jgi:hypothetical protein